MNVGIGLFPTVVGRTICRGLAGAFLVLCTASLHANDAQQVDLRYKFVPGQLVRYDVQLNDDYRIQVGEDKDTPYSHQSSVKNYRVKEVEADGSAILELTIESVNLEIHQNGETFRYNSQQQEKDEEGEDAALSQPVFLAMKALVGKPHLQLRVTPHGDVSAFVPLVPGDQVPDNPGQVAFDVLLRLPDEPIAVGGTWKEDFEINLPIPESSLRKPVKVKRHYTLKSLEGSLATIELNTKVLTILDLPEEQMQLLRRRPSGTIVLDLDRGLLVSKNLKQDNEVSGFNTGPSHIRFQQVLTEKLRDAAVVSGDSSSTSK